MRGACSIWPKAQCIPVIGKLGDGAGGRKEYSPIIAQSSEGNQVEGLV